MKRDLERRRDAKGYGEMRYEEIMEKMNDNEAENKTDKGTGGRSGAETISKRPVAGSTAFSVFEPVSSAFDHTQFAFLFYFTFLFCLFLPLLFIHIKYYHTSSCKVSAFQLAQSAHLALVWLTFKQAPPLHVSKTKLYHAPCTTPFAPTSAKYRYKFKSVKQ